MNNNTYRYSLERYRGRGSRYTCPQCGRKYAFTRYIDNTNNQYVADNVGKCNRLDKCGYHYTPRQYFEDNPWRRDDSFSNFQKHRGFEQIEQKEPPVPKLPRGQCPRMSYILPYPLFIHSVNLSHFMDRRTLNAVLNTY